MAQARRKSTKRSSGASGAWINFLFLLIGLICGALLTNLYNGYQKPPVEMGQGLKQISKQLRNVETERTPPPSDPAPPPAQKEPELNFYTVLPEQEQVITSFNEESATISNTAGSLNKSDRYVLQVASFNKAQDADRMRAKLALLGIESHVQKVSIEGKGTFMRVRVGPFENASDAQRIDAELKSNGLNPMRLKLSSGQ